MRVNHKRFFGYDKDENGELIIDEEAGVVRRIYDEYLGGLGYKSLASRLLAVGIKMTWQCKMV